LKDPDLKDWLKQAVITCGNEELIRINTVISRGSSQKIFKKSGFNFFTNLLVFAVSQTWQHNLS